MKKPLILIFLVAFAIQPIQSLIFASGNQPSADKNSRTAAIASKSLSVTVNQKFPAIVEYKWLANGKMIFGNEDPLTRIKINGKLYTPAVSFSKTRYAANYILNINDIGVIIKISISITNNVVDFSVTQIDEQGTFKVNSIEIPDHNLLSVRSSQAKALFSGAKMFTAVKGNGDLFLPVTSETVTDSLPKDFLFGILNTAELAASIWSNSVTEKTDNSRIQKQTVRKTGYTQTGIWSGGWIYRAQGMTQTDPLPMAKIVITADANGDHQVDWQDGAIAYRTIMNNPLGSERIPDLVVQRIPMNFASQATNPFTKTLDETKRIFLNTDGLGQFVILKGYGSEGHDSKHPDYGDIGKRQGGAKDMEMLCKAAQKYNAFMGVHINGTESYPEAVAFDDSLVTKAKKGWDWLDASYYMDKRYDATSNNRMVRLESLKNQVPSLNFIYCDVWYAGGSWDSKKLGREIHSLGLTLATEFPSDHESDAVWNHWAVDYDYGGKNIKGFNSQIVRFILNHQKDTWIARHPLLGGEEMKDFEGWQGRNDFNNCIRMTFTTDLPTKYLQHFPIVKWEDNTITLEKNVQISNTTGKRIISKDDRIVLEGDAYLLPWNPKTEDKLYHWNSVAGSTSWTLPISWTGINTVMLYQLSDQGRSFVQELAVLNGQILIPAKAETPYVIYKQKVEPTADIAWGEGTLLKDPGFNQGNLKYWKTEGSGSSVVRNKLGQYELVFAEGAAAKVSQTITGLESGKYYASVYVSVLNGRKAALEISEYGGVNQTVYCNSSLWKNYIAADSKSDTTMQRMYVFFEVPKGRNSAVLTLKVDAGAGSVVFDDVRVVKINHPLKPADIYFSEDFENIPDGLYPFVKGPSGGINDPRTHLAELHAPYTQKDWNGKPIDDVISGNWSLKAHGEPTGLLLQTIPQTLRFMPGKTYTITFKYEASGSDYALVTGAGIIASKSVILDAVGVPTLVTLTITGDQSGNSWFGIEKLNDKETDLVIDDLMVTEK